MMAVSKALYSTQIRVRLAKELLVFCRSFSMSFFFEKFKYDHMKTVLSAVHDLDCTLTTGAFFHRLPEICLNL